MFIVGCGYIGRRLLANLRPNHHLHTCLVRSSTSCEQLRGDGSAVIQADLDRVPLPPLPSAGAKVFYLAPPPIEGVQDTRITHFLQATARDGEPKRIVYISTTGVYGDCAGEWVDETRPARPMVDRARRRWDAEQQLRAWRERTGGELVILRVAGIYGPGKLPLERLRKSAPMVSEQEAPWTNRIHADDLVQVCLAAMAHGGDGEIYNVSDGHPGNMTDYFNRVADLAGLPRPPIVPLDQAEGALSAGLRSYLAESRRLDNRKLREELGVVLKYPTLAEGLPACFGEAEARAQSSSD